MDGKLAADAAFKRGAELFNREDYFAAHEVWEEAWLSAGGETRQFLQGLIQWSVALHHFRNGNLPGARKLFASGESLLAAFPPVWQGISLEELRQTMVACLRELFQSPVASGAGSYSTGSASQGKRPVIRFSP
jgi:predicted metal-dependent hydrolase